MTDRELLEWAAKAAGIVRDHTDDSWYQSGGGSCRANWSPLTDDGDEARLEARLGLHVRWRTHHVEVGRLLDDTWQESYALHGGDKQAARRYAGVRAAAAIGRASDA